MCHGLSIERLAACQGCGAKASMLVVGSLGKKYTHVKSVERTVGSRLGSDRGIWRTGVSCLGHAVKCASHAKTISCVSCRPQEGKGQQEKNGKRTILFFSKGEAPLTGRVASAISVMFAGFWIDFEDRRARTEGVYVWYGGDVWRKGRAGCLYFFLVA